MMFPFVHLFKGVDIQAYDKQVPLNPWTNVLQGTPKKTLSLKSNQNRNLFLCYCDQYESMGLQCLKYFQGEFIIHVGELIHTGCASGSPQAPWGRSSGPDFQVKLSELYHLVLTKKLDISFPFANDYLTVWKRTNIFDAKKAKKDLAGDADNDGDGDGGDDGDDGEQEADSWCDIPPNERIKSYATELYTHLL